MEELLGRADLKVYWLNYIFFVTKPVYSGYINEAVNVNTGDIKNT